MSLNLIAVRRVTLSLVALFAFFLGSLQVAFAEEAYDAENPGLAEASTDVAEGTADDADQDVAANDAAVPQLAQATDVDSNAVADNGNQDGIPKSPPTRPFCIPRTGSSFPKTSSDPASERISDSAFSLAASSGELR